MNNDILKGAEPFFTYLISDVYDLMVESYGQEITEQLFENMYQRRDKFEKNYQPDDDLMELINKLMEKLT